MGVFHRKSTYVGLMLSTLLLAPLCANAFFGVGTVPVVDWSAITRLGRQIGISQQTLSTLNLYIRQYNRINEGVHQGVHLYRGRRLQGILSQAVGSRFPEFERLQRDFRNVLVDPATLREDLEATYGSLSLEVNVPLVRHRRMDAADATATLGLLDAARMEAIAQQEELDASAIEDRAAVVSPSGAAKLSAAASGALLRSQAYNHRLLARLLRLQALSIARENSIEKEQEQIRQEQLQAVSSLVGGMKLSYGIGEGARR